MTCPITTCQLVSPSYLSVDIEENKDLVEVFLKTVESYRKKVRHCLGATVLKCYKKRIRNTAMTANLYEIGGAKTNKAQSCICIDYITT